MKERAADPVPYETLTALPGRLGLNLLDAQDRLQPEEACILCNLVSWQQGRLEVRDGQTSIATNIGGSNVHSLQRIDFPDTGDWTRFWGAGTSLARGKTQADMTVIDGGYSGDPLTFQPYRPALTGESWMIVSDANKIRQVPPGGAPIPLGLPAPADPVEAEVAEILTTAICAFDSTASGGGSSVAANWTMTAGTTRPSTDSEGDAADPPTAADVTGVSGNAVEFTTAPGSVNEGYSSIVGISRTIDLSILQAGPTQELASDQDIVHLWVRVDHPEWVDEVRIYLVCSDGFDPTVIPGTSTTVNTDAFTKALEPHAFEGFVAGFQSAVDAGTVSRSRDTLSTFLATDGLSPRPDAAALQDPSFSNAGSESLPTQPSPQLLPGQQTWSEFGNTGRPLRRGEFLRIGNQAERGWNTITGLILVIWTNTGEAVKVAGDDWFLTGGFPLDTTDPSAVKYDWRYTHYHTVTGDEGNPSPIMAEPDWLECLRQRVNLQPAFYGDPDVRQRFYRRGGSLPTDWYFVGENEADGAEFTDEVADDSAATAGTVELDNDQPVSSIDADGDEIEAQPVPVVFGPVEGYLYALGDPNRPGHLYQSKLERAGSWPPSSVYEVCTPSEQLLCGFEMAGQGWVHSRQRLYRVSPNVTASGATTVQSTACLKGVASRWSWYIGAAGYYFVSRGPGVAGIYVSLGDAPEYLSEKIEPLFKGVNVSPYYAVDWDEEERLRLCVHQQFLFFFYVDVNGTDRTLVYDLVRKTWHPFTWANPIAVGNAEEPPDDEPVLVMGGASDGKAYLYEGATDDGDAIFCQVRTGALDFARPREDKLLGDFVFDADVGTDVPLTLYVFLNNGDVANSAMTVDGVAGRTRYTFDPFGIVPQRARNVQFDLSWTHAAAGIVSTPVVNADGTAAAPQLSGTSSLFLMGVAIAPQPDQIMKRATAWEQPNVRGECYLTGVEVIIDTGNSPVTYVVERTLNDTIFTVDTLVITTSGQRLQQFSWPVVKADQVRLRPTAECAPHILWKCTWLFDPEPPRISKWDSNWENLGDSYYTGLDLEIDTFGVDKTIRVWVDQVNIDNPAGGQTFTVNTSGRQYVHLTLGPARGHVYRFTSDDDNVGLLYSHKWHVDEEPSEQHNWNQNFSIEGALSDKWIKGILIECDTFNQQKTVRVEIDGVLHTTIYPQADGREVLQFSWAQGRGRVLRLLPIDHLPARIYSWQWIFDEEPLQLGRWETQEIDHQLTGHEIVFGAYVTYRSEATVLLHVDIYAQNGSLVNRRQYPLIGTEDIKRKAWVPFYADKGVLYKYTFTSAEAFWLYREESSVLIFPWGANQPVQIQPFGSDDLDKVRSLGRASAIAARSGGGTSRPNQFLPSGEGLTGGHNG